MATTEEELRRLDRELRQMSMMTGAVRSAQARLVSTMTRHSDTVSKSIITTLQEIKGSSDTTRLTKKRLEILQKQLEKAQAENKATDELTDQIETLTKELQYVKFQTLATSVTSVAGGMMSLAASVRETQQTFGIVAGQAATLQFQNLKQSIVSYIDALKGAGPAATLEQIAQTQIAFQEQFGGVLDPEAAKRLTQEAIKMGVTAEQMAEARRVFMTQTGGNLAQATTQTNKFIGEFEKKGLTAKDAMKAIQQNSELLARNGTRFAGQLARAMADAKKIGVEFSKISQFGDSVISDFESFLEKSAELGAMGFGLDTSRLAEIAETGSDADLFNELRSQLAATGKDINNLRRSERLAIEGMFGMTIGEMQKLAAPGTAGSGEKTMEQNQKDTNDKLATIISVFEGFGKALAVMGSIISGVIAASSVLTSLNTSFIPPIATALGATIPAILTGVLSALTPLVAIGATIALIWGAVQLWKLGSKNVEEGKQKILSGQEGGAGQLIKGRAQQGAVYGAGTGTVLGALAAGALLTGTGVGAGVGIPLMLAAMGAGGTTLGVAGGTIGAATGAVQAGNLKRTVGDDVISQPGYGKRSLVTPSGVIALNNKDNIIAYADDLMGTKRLPLGAISKALTAYKAGMGLANKNIPGFTKYMPQATDLYGTYKQSGTTGLKATAIERGLGFLGNRIPQLAGSADVYKQGGTGGLKSSLLDRGLGLLGSKVPMLSGAISAYKEGGFGGLKTNLMTTGMETLGKRIPGLSSAMGVFSGYKQGGVKGALGSLTQGGIGKGIGAAIGTAIPIPFVGTAVGSLVGSKLGKLAGGLFGRKKAEPTTISPEMMAASSPDLSTMLGSQQTTQIQRGGDQKPITVDTTGIEQKLNNFINALQNIQINMDGTRVGNILVNSSNLATSLGVMNVQSRTVSR